MKRSLQLAGLLAALAACFVFAVPNALGEGGIIEVVPNTAVLLSNTASSGGGGNGGNTSSASSATNIFSPASYVDYHERGGEPTTVVDRYPFGPGTMPSCGLLGAPVGPPNPTCTQQAACASPTATCTHDLVYVSNPIGLGLYSEFYKSADGGQTFRVPTHNPYFFNEPVGTEESGGGDSHHAVGEITHSVFMTDLSGGCVTMNVSRDLGESFSSNKLSCETNPGAIDDRQWVATDETPSGPDVGKQDVFLTFNNDTLPFTLGTCCAAIILVKSTDDGGINSPGDWGASACTSADAINPALPAPADSDPTACPDPRDENLWVSGPVVVDKSQAPHRLYLPFERLVGDDFQLYVAISTDEGNSWTRHKVHDLGPHDAANIFPQLTVDTAGDVYFTWAQAQTFNPDTPQDEGETDAYYTYSTGGGLEGTWSPPINLTKETGDSAVFPWMVAGSPGQVDLVLYKANSGLNPNIAFYEANGKSCDPDTATGSCSPNTTAWNTYFGQSQNALNPGPNFKLVQISDHVIHTGGLCTGGTGCEDSPQANRDLLDFLTVDVDHTGAAYTTWADDNNGRHDTWQFFSRQLSGNSIFKGQNIAAMNAYPITDHAVTDQAGDVNDAAGVPEGGCGAMDVLGSSAKRNPNDTLTVTLTLGAPPTSTQALACSREGVSGGLWGAQFWAASTPNLAQDNQFGNNNFYIAYRDNPEDITSPTPGVEAGALNAISISLTHFEYSRYEAGTLGGTCLTAAGVVSPTAPTPCTITLTASLAGLGIKSGSILSAVSGFSVYFFGTEQNPPGLRVPIGNSNLADIATPFDVNGTGTIVK